MNAADLAFAVADRMPFELTAPSASRLVNGSLDARIRTLCAFRLSRAADLLREAEVLLILATGMANHAMKAKPMGVGAVQLQPYDALVD